MPSLLLPFEYSCDSVMNGKFEKPKQKQRNSIGDLPRRITHQMSYVFAVSMDRISLIRHFAHIIRAKMIYIQMGIFPSLSSFAKRKLISKMEI